jgi:hypothetical protein
MTYQRFRKWTVDRILSCCEEDGDCLIWTGLNNSIGIPKIRNTSGRRVMWELKNGEIPPGMLVSTTCGRAGCLEHLALSTKSEIVARSHERPHTKARVTAANRRSARRERAKINMDIAREIRASDETGLAIAARLGISNDLVSLVRQGKSWREPSPFAGLMR